MDSTGTMGSVFTIDSAATDATFPAVACSGGNYMVVWQQHDPGGGHDVRGQLVDYETLDGSMFSVWSSYYDQHSPRIAYNHTANEYCVVMQTEYNSGDKDDTKSHAGLL